MQDTKKGGDTSQVEPPSVDFIEGEDGEYHMRELQPGVFFSFPSEAELINWLLQLEEGGQALIPQVPTCFRNVGEGFLPTLNRELQLQRDIYEDLYGSREGENPRDETQDQ